MKRPLLIIQPATSYDDLPELCADYGDELAWFARGCGVPEDEVVSVKVYAGESLPEPSDVRGAIITGAIDMVTDNHGWIKTLADWTLRAIDAELPMLGVCFGHQLMAHALGGEVGDNPNGAAFGNVPVIKKALAETDDLFIAFPAVAETKVFHYQSVLTLPAEATVLVSSANDPYYAVRFGACAWGVQFHPEFDNHIMDRTCEVYAGAMAEAGYEVADIRARNTDDGSGSALLRRFAEITDGEPRQNVAQRMVRLCQVSGAQLRDRVS